MWRPHVVCRVLSNWGKNPKIRRAEIANTYTEHMWFIKPESNCPGCLIWYIWKKCGCAQMAAVNQVRFTIQSIYCHVQSEESMFPCTMKFIFCCPQWMPEIDTNNSYIDTNKNKIIKNKIEKFSVYIRMWYHATQNNDSCKNKMSQLVCLFL